MRIQKMQLEKIVLGNNNNKKPLGRVNDSLEIIWRISTEFPGNTLVSE